MAAGPGGYSKLSEGVYYYFGKIDDIQTVPSANVSIWVLNQTYISEGGNSRLDSVATQLRYYETVTFTTTITTSSAAFNFNFSELTGRLWRVLD